MPWYDFAQTRAEHDAFWATARRRVVAAGLASIPEALTRHGSVRRNWRDPSLLLSQACGYDVLLRDAPPLRLVATPVFDYDGCSGPNYSSHIVTRGDLGRVAFTELMGLRCVINGRASHSGMNGLRAMTRAVTSGRFFASVAVTDSHEESLARVQRGEADVASIDCITYGLLQRFRPSALDGIRQVERTAAVAAPPFVTHASTPDEVVGVLRDALAHATAQPSGRALGLRGVEELSLDDYAPIAVLAARGPRSADDEYRGEPLAERWGVEPVSHIAARA